MTIYIIKNNFYELFSSFTDRKLADEECASMNVSAAALYIVFSVIELPLTTDSFMESVLTNKDSK